MSYDLTAMRLDRSRPLRDQIYPMVRSLLLTGAIAPGEIIDEKAIVPASAAGLERLAKECPTVAWKVGQEADVTVKGCGALVPAHDACPIEYDLMRLSSGKLYFGDRSVPLCTEATRPKKLSVWGIGFDHAL